ncbi:MAG: DUF6603 domain-containing protein [Blastocatellia bacterium]
MPGEAGAEEELRATISLKAPAAWKFSQSFADLPASWDLRSATNPTTTPILDGLSLRESWLIFATHPREGELTLDGMAFGAAKLRAGLNYLGRWNPNEVVGALAHLSLKELSLFGPIIKPGAEKGISLSGSRRPWDEPKPPGVHLEADFGASTQIGALNIASFFRLYSPLSSAWLKDNPNCDPVMALEGDLDAASGVSMRMTAERMLGGGDQVVFSSSFNDNAEGGFNIDSLAKLLGDGYQTDFLKTILPEPIAKAVDAWSLKGLAVKLVRQGSGSPAGYRVSYSYFCFGLALPKIELITGMLSLDRVELIEVKVTDPFGSSEPLADRITGTLVFDSTFLGAKVRATLTLPDFWIQLRLAESLTIPLKQMFRDHGISEALAPADLVIEDFVTGGDLAGDYQLSATIAGSPPWAFDVGTRKVTIKKLGFGLAKAPNAGWQGSFAGTITLGDESAANAQLLEVDLTTEVGAGNGWRFRGSTSTSAGIGVGALVSSIAHHFGEIPVPESIRALTVDALSLNFDTGTGEFSCAMAVKFPVGGKEHNVRLSLDIRRQTQGQGQGYDKKFHLTFDRLQFELLEHGQLILASYAGNAAVKPHDLARIFSQDLADLIPKEIDITIKSAYFAHMQDAAPAGSGPQSKKGRFLFGIDLSAGIDLRQVPLAGREFPPARKAGIDDLQVLIASQAFSAAEVATLNGLLPPGVTPLPDISKVAGQPQGGQDATTTIALKQGLNIGAKLNLGGTTRGLTLPVAAGGAASSPSGAPVAGAITPAATTTDNATWLKIQKALGPVNVDRIGVQYKDARVWFLLDASLAAAGLTLSLSGLSVGSSISKFEPQFELRGIGIDYRTEALEIGGAFLKVADKEYAGAAVLKAKALTLSALGMYKEMADGHPSVFVYAVLDYPLGGPAFFFVTGLAAGFGYSRALKIPAIENVATFSLVQNARGGAGMPADLTGELRKLANDITPAAGENFLAIGVKFTSFKIVDSFALLTVSFGGQFELNLLGLSSLVAPPNAGVGIPPVAEVQLALKASFQPEKGFLGVQAQLTPNSYLLSKSCRLTGGFAFFSWFGDNEHAGDFVLSLGGYHPRFKAPAHYPAVPRLGFNWQVSPQLSLKGDAYFALTASALMAGGDFEATWQSDSVRAWFKIGANFLIAWKPYHYEASMYVDMGVEVTFEFFGTHQITVDVGADLNLWGPDFSGAATIHLWIISFTVEFGAGVSHKPAPLDWPAFKSSFLPDKEVCGIAVTGGLIAKSSQEPSDLGIINPKTFSLTTNSVIPSTASRYSRKDPGQAVPLVPSQEIYGTPGRFGIAPMEVKADGLTSMHTITIKREGDFVGEEFVYAPIFKKAPAGLWGEVMTPELNGKPFIENALSGFEIRPKSTATSGAVVTIERGKLREGDASGTGEYRWESLKPFVAEEFADGEAERKDELQLYISDDAAVRQETLRALGFTAEELRLIDSSTMSTADFLIAPQIELGEGD